MFGCLVGWLLWVEWVWGGCCAWELGWVVGGLWWVFGVWGGWYWKGGGELLGVNWIWTFGWVDSPGGFFVIGLE